MLVPPLAVMRAMSPRMRCRFGGALQPDHRRRLAVEHDDRDLVGRGQRLGGGARRLLGQLHLGARHRARPVDHQRQRQRRLLAPVGDVEPHGQHRLQARRHVAAGTEALRAARDQQAAALRGRSRPAPPASGRAARRAARRPARPDRSGRSRSRAPAPRAARTSAAMCSAASARANDPARPPASLPGRARAASRSVAIASTPSSFSGWRSPPVRGRAARAASLVPGSVMRTVNASRSSAPGAERRAVCSGSSMRDVRIAGAVQPDARLGRPDRRAGARRPGTACAARTSSGAVSSTTATSPALVGRQRRARTAACRDRAAARRPRPDRRASATPSEISSRRGMAVASTSPAPKLTASAMSVAAPAGGGRRAMPAAGRRRRPPRRARRSGRRAARGSPRSAAARAERGDGLRPRTPARRRTRCRRRRPAPRPTRRAPGGASVGPASADGHARQHQRPQQRLQRAAARAGNRRANAARSARQQRRRQQRSSSHAGCSNASALIARSDQAA